jgi:hypothetical protein
MKRVPWFEAALVLAVLGIHLFAATSDAHNLASNWFTRDDAYYYFKVAQNISEGRGSTFDGINPTNGYHPLWMLICVPVFALARFDLILPLRILLILQGCLSAAAGVLLYRLIRGALSHPVAILAACWWTFDLYIHATMYEVGLETGLAAFTLTLLIYLLWKAELQWRTHRLTRGQIAGLAFAAVLVLFSRLDLVFLALLAGLWIILRVTPMRFLLPLDALIAVAGILLSFLYRLGLPDYYPYGDAALFMIAASVSSKILLYYFLGLYQPPGSMPVTQLLWKTALAVSLSSIVVVAGMFGFSGWFGSFPRTALLYDWGFNLLGMVLLRLLARAFAQKKTGVSLPPIDLLRQNWRRWLEEAAVFYGIAGGVLGTYMLWNHIAIGSATPVSGEIKRWWGDFASRVYGGTARNVPSFWGLGFENDFDAWRPFSIILQGWSREIAIWRDSLKPESFYPPLVMFFILVALAILFLNRRMAVRGAMQLSLPMLLTASFAQIVSYNITGYAGMKEWYWVSEPIFVVLGASLILSILIKPVEKIRPVRLVLFAVAGMIGFYMAWGLGNLTALRMPHGVHSPDLPYMDSARFLEDHTPPGATIGMTGGGNVGYYISERTIVNMDGLINSPAYFEALKDGGASEYLTGIGVDYIFANPEILRGLPYRGQYHTGEILARYGGKALMVLQP